MEQPKNSKIKISKTADTLEIYIPPARFRCYMTTVILGMELILSFPILLLAYGVYSAELPYKFACAAFSVPFLTGAIGMGAFLPIFFFAKANITIDHKTIEMGSDIFGFRVEAPTVIQRKDLIKITLTERYTVDERAEIIFEVDTDEYSTRKLTDTQFSEPEISWLAHEISTFLEIPITKQPSPNRGKTGILFNANTKQN